MNIIVSNFLGKKWNAIENPITWINTRLPSPIHRVSYSEVSSKATTKSHTLCSQHFHFFVVVENFYTHLYTHMLLIWLNDLVFLNRNYILGLNAWSSITLAHMYKEGLIVDEPGFCFVQTPLVLLKKFICHTYVSCFHQPIHSCQHFLVISLPRCLLWRW